MTELQERAKNIAFGACVMALLFGGAGFLANTSTTRLVAIGGLVLLVLSISFLLTMIVSELTRKALEKDGSVQKARSELLTTVKQQKEISERFEKIKFLGDLLKTISGSNELGSILDNMLDETMKFFGAKSGFIMLVDKDAKELYVERARAVDGQPISTGRLPIGEGAIGTVAATGTPRLIGSAKKLPGRYQSLTSSASQSAMMCAPLRIERKIIGVLTVEEKETDENFTDSDLEFLSLIAAETGIAIEKARLYERMEQMSVTDGLTGVANRRYFDMRFHDELLKAKRYSLPLSVTLMDIDNFKSFNDTYGHAVGDEVLKAVARNLKSNVRETDLVARYGGEEFIIVSPDCETDKAGTTADRLRQNLEQMEVYGNEEYPSLKITMSLGVANYPDDSQAEEALLKAADDALYASKKSGRNQVTIYRNLQT